MNGLIIFSHGLDSGPHSNKNEYLRPVAERLGWPTVAVDDRDIHDNPPARIDRLVERIHACAEPPVLVGSSLGGYVSVSAAERSRVAGLWLLAPALFMEDRYEHADPALVAREAYTPMTERISVIHGWNDDIIPWQNSMKFAEQHQAQLHLLKAGHRLENVLPVLAALLADFLLPEGD
ncbi:MAG: YqiA/YcfP family alpha/beta fold hydrolase [Pseudomonadota bacterium]